MTPRQEALLKELIETYVGAAEPVSSALLAKQMRVSSATVRNELASLEEEGFLHQPHTSAGRVPTVKAYEYYIQRFLKPSAPTPSVQKRLNDAGKKPDSQKSLARVLAELTGVAVLVGHDNDSFFYTGLSQLFAQPEFTDQSYVVSLSAALDALDKVMPKLMERCEPTTSVVVGDQNPFGANSAVFIRQVSFKNGQDGICILLTPLRTDYNRQIGLLDSLTSE